MLCVGGAEVWSLFSRETDTTVGYLEQLTIMYLAEIKEVIAVRELSLTEAQGITRKVKVSIGKPEPFPDSEGYYCPFQISGAGLESIKYAAGIDAVQALQLVMVMIGATLQFLAKETSGTLQWEGNSQSDFGFPTSIEK